MLTLLRRLRRWHIERVSRGQLARMDPEFLADLGMVRGDIDRLPRALR